MDCGGRPPSSVTSVMEAASVGRLPIRRGIPHLPGVATASEVLRAKAFGLSWLKAFPASVLGQDWIKAMKGPFPDVHFIATGGMRAATANAYLNAGFSAVGLSSDFASDKGPQRSAISLHQATERARRYELHR